MLNLTQVKYFCVAYQMRSFRKAAESLFLTRQALSKSIAALEEEIGGELFARQNTILTPTALADHFYPEAVRLLELQDTILADMHEFAGVNGQSLRIGATFSAFETYDPAFPMTFQQKYPNIRLSVTTRPDKELEKMILSDELDGAIAAGEAEDGQHIESMCIHREPLYLVGTPELMAGRRLLRFAELAEIPLLTVDAQFKVQDQLMERFTRFGCQPKICFASSDFSLLMTLCRQGKGAVLMPESRLHNVLMEGLTAVQLDPEEDPGWNLYFLRRKGRSAPYALRTFENALTHIE